METTSGDIQKLREAFFAKLNSLEQSETELFHSADLAKIKNGDDWLRRFLLHHENDQKEALNMLWEACDWRKKFGTNDITESNVNRELLENGNIFSHSRDKDGRALLIFRSKKHFKSQYDFDDQKRALVYWMERLERQENGQMISIFFDMDGAGLSNMDMEYTRYIIHLFKLYYPYFLNNILIFEMAWVLNAAFKVIKTWLPPKAVQKIKNLNKNNIKDYIDPDKALKSWGGTDEYVFQFEPEEDHNESDETKGKKVHFAEEMPNGEVSSSPVATPVRQNHNNSNASYKLEITPSDVLYFSREGPESTETITLRNNDEKFLSYKIKTTAPEKFRVRPSFGILPPNASASIAVVLQAGYNKPQVARDKFLVMAIPVDGANVPNQELAEIWKGSSANIMQQRICVGLKKSIENVNNVITDNDRLISKLNTDVSKLQSKLESLHEELHQVHIQLWVLILLVGLLAGLVLYFVNSSKESVNKELFPTAMPNQQP